MKKLSQYIRLFIFTIFIISSAAGCSSVVQKDNDSSQNIKMRLQEVCQVSTAYGDGVIGYTTRYQNHELFVEMRFQCSNENKAETLSQNLNNHIFLIDNDEKQVTYDGISNGVAQEDGKKEVSVPVTVSFKNVDVQQEYTIMILDNQYTLKMKEN